MIVLIEESSVDVCMDFKVHNKKTYDRIEKLIQDINRDPYTVIQKHKALKGELSDYYSRKTDKRNRIIYKFEQYTIIIA